MAHENEWLVTGHGAGGMQFLPPLKYVDNAGNVIFQVDSSGNATFLGTVTSAGATDSGGNLVLTGNITVNTNKFTVAGASGNTVIAGNLTMSGSGKIVDLSAIGASNAAVKYVETSDTPTVAFTDNGGASHAPTTAPHGYLKVLVGSTPYYIPAWA